MIVNEVAEKNRGESKTIFFRLAGSYRGYYFEIVSDDVIKAADKGKAFADTTKKTFHIGRTLWKIEIGGQLFFRPYLCISWRFQENGQPGDLPGLKGAAGNLYQVRIEAKQIKRITT